MNRTAPLIPLLLALGLACASPVEPPRAPTTPRPANLPADINDDFLDPKLEVASWIERFEGESREVAASRDRIVETLALAPGMDVADVGAGTGLFLEPLAEGVAPGGTVHAIDIAPAFVEHLDERIAANGWTHARALLCTDRSIRLAPGSVDLVFVCDTYHHFEHPAATLASIRRALRPGGRLVVVEFDRVPGQSRDFVLEHVRAGKAEFRAEIEAAGFRFFDEPEVAGLAENYVQRFTRP